jgi:hypothetical protein
MKLHQLLAVLQSAKNNSAKAKTAVYHLAQKPFFKGLSRTYEPREEEGFVYPPESQNVQLKAEKLIEQFVEASSEYLDLCASQDLTNTTAKASVVVDGVTILKDVPVTHLLFLEKQLIDVKTFISSLPVLDADKEWEYSTTRGCWVTPTRKSAKTKKITKPVVLYEATKEHPAQVKEVSEDVVEGTWTNFDMSGALPQDKLNELLVKAEKLIKAVVIAREEANSIEVKQFPVASPLFVYLFGNS